MTKSLQVSVKLGEDGDVNELHIYRAEEARIVNGLDASLLFADCPRRKTIIRCFSASRSVQVIFTGERMVGRTMKVRVSLGEVALGARVLFSLFLYSDFEKCSATSSKLCCPSISRHYERSLQDRNRVTEAITAPNFVYALLTV